jgi:hypothetical protein
LLIGQTARSSRNQKKSNFFPMIEHDKCRGTVDDAPIVSLVSSSCSTAKHDPGVSYTATGINGS